VGLDECLKKETILSLVLLSYLTCFPSFSTKLELVKVLAHLLDFRIHNLLYFYGSRVLA